MKELWVEKYRPKTVDGYVFRDEHQKKQVQQWIKEETIPHLLFSGNAGIGKTTLAKELALKSSAGEIKPSEINEELFNSELLTGGIKDPELLIRTSGEKRISNFLLWQLAYSEIYISDVLWPEFNEHEFLKAIIDYQSRNRRFGGIESLPNESFEDSQYFS